MIQTYYQEKRRQYLEDGFCVIENVLLQEMRAVTDRLIDAVSESDNEKQRSTGRYDLGRTQS